MDPRFQYNNMHLDNDSTFSSTDPHLRRLYAEQYVYRSSLIDEMPRDKPAILTLGGGRQIGKTTLLKQWMEDLLKNGVEARAICFFSGELIGDHTSLFKLIESQLKDMPSKGIKYLILDEVTDIKEWDKAVKYLADIGLLSDVILVLSGSDLVLMQDARKRFPGRRGRVAKVDFHYYPLSFSEFLQLKKMDNAATSLAQLYQEFDYYLIHGGFLTAINDYAKHGKIADETLNIYSDWIRGDILKRNKHEHYLEDIITAVVKHYGRQISWVNLVKELTIDHTQTVADYIALLGSMDAVFVQAALIEDKLKPAPKKRKKLMFCDPFIYHAMRAWLEPVENSYERQIIPLFSQPERLSHLVEATVITHFRRFASTYYISAKGEVDIAYIHKKQFWPIEIKWTNQLRAKDLKQISKYTNGEIYAKTMENGEVNGIPIKPLPLALQAVDANFAK